MEKHLLIRFHLALAIIFLAATLAPKAAARGPIGQSPQGALGLTYTLSFPQPHSHLYEVSFAISNVAAPALDLQMPTWTPGSYLQREFARHVQDFAARDEAGRELRWQKVDKATWRVETAAGSGRPRTVNVFYRVYANELSVRTSHLDATHAYFNGASVFMYVRGATDQPLRLKINAPQNWRVTTPLGLAPDRAGFYTAPGYDLLVDSPTEIGTHRLLEFSARGKPHRIAIWGNADYDEARMKADFAKIVEEGAEMFGGLPYDHYTFIIHVQPNIGGGLEHLNSTTLQVRPGAFGTRRNYVNFLNLTSHEYFHLWNVKRIRPHALGPFDYQRENYTRALWVSEGFTDYYGMLLLRRAGLITAKEFFDLLGREMLAYEQTPGRKEQSAEDASFDTWIKFYRPDENSLNTSISYYNKGALLGWMLDLEIRARTRGAKTLDDVMRFLYENYALRGVGFPEHELKGAFEKVAGGSFTDFWSRYVSGTDEIDFNRHLQMAGLMLERRYRRTADEAEEEREPEPRGDLGLRTSATGDRVVVSSVLAGMPAYEGGINSGDEVVAINGERVTATNLADRMNAIKPRAAVAVTVFRRERIMTFNLVAAPKPPDRYVITPVKEPTAEQRAVYRAWVGEEMKVTRASDAQPK